MQNPTGYIDTNKIKVPFDMIETALNDEEKKILKERETMNSISKENIKEILEIIRELKWDKSAVYYYIWHSLINKKYSDVEEIINILIEYDIIDEHFKNRKLDPTEEEIEHDNVDFLVNCSSMPDFDPNKGKYNNCMFIEEIESTYSNNKFNYYASFSSISQLILFFGAVKCLKFALLNESFCFNGLENFAIAGGNVEVIHLLEKNGRSFDNCFINSIRFHRHNVSSYLLNNYKCEEICLAQTILLYNYRAFFFLLKNGINIDSFSINSAFYAACSIGNLNMIKYLYDNFDIDLGFQGFRRKNSLCIASKHELFETIRFLINKCGADVNSIDSNGKNALYYAAFEGKEEVAKRLIIEFKANRYLPTEENGKHITLDLYEQTVLAAIRINDIDYVKYFFENNEWNKEDNYLKELFLTRAVEYGSLQTLKYLVEHIKFDISQFYCSFKDSLKVAYEKGHTDVLEYISEKFSIEYVNYEQILRI